MGLEPYGSMSFPLAMLNCILLKSSALLKNMDAAALLQNITTVACG